MWAVGYFVSGGISQTLVEHWNGSAWSVVPSPNVGTSHNWLFGVSAVSGSDVQAVGYYQSSGVYQTLVERYNPCTGSPTPSVTGTSPTATGTPTPTNTPVVTGTPPTNTRTTTNTPTSSTPTPTVIGTPPTNAPTATTTNTPLAATATATPTLTATATATATQCSLQFEYVPSPNPGSGIRRLYGVAVVSANDVWAVGFYSSNSAAQTLIEHWDGIQWSIVASPNGPSGGSFLKDVAAASPNDVWAVGYWGSFTLASQTLIEHWDGIQWSIVPSPNLGTDANSLMGIAAAGSSDIWAVGFSGQNLGHDETMTMHWNGSLWSIVPSPNPGSDYSILYGVAVVSTNDVWAVGSYVNGPLNQTLTEHWNGTVWSAVSSPNPFGSYGSSLTAVVVVSTNDVWAVGGYITDPYLAQTLTEHWNGTVWSVVPSPSPGSDGSHLFRVAVVSASDMWAVGYYHNSGDTIVQTLTEHWNGTVWSVVPSPSPGSGGNILNGVAVVSANDVWAVGGADDLVTERYNPCASSPTPTVTGTPPTSTPSPTAAPPPSPTSCSIQFTDVPVGSTFYSYIRCLACHGIINGYSDGSFKPNNNVTRGQLSKIISNAAGFIDPQTTQMFQDVPVGSTFFNVIGRLASRGYIGGYPCGVGEPCVPPGNLPYFRPNANATRGQISKINSNAAGYSDTPTGQRFEDVPPGSTYYTYTYRLVSRSIMAGYACGGTGEPCIPPDNRPYFRPNNNETRGQTSKIVGNTFYPNCQTPSAYER